MEHAKGRSCVLVMSLLIASLTSVSAEVENKEVTERIGKRAARCAAYFFMAANAKGVADFERNYSAGELAYNESVRRIGNDLTLQEFNDASKEMNGIMNRRWVDFTLVEGKYAATCSDISEISAQRQQENTNER